MPARSSYACWMLTQEARALLTRLERIKSFAMSETMVPAAALTVEAQAAIERHLHQRRSELRGQVERYLEWLRSPRGAEADPAEAQRRFTFIRLRFNVVLSQFDIFSEAMSQRSEVDNGVWLAGLDIAARDALELPGYYQAPPVICYLARGPGAAIRRAHTRLPGGEDNPVAIIRMPRERMIGASIASSLFHEVGHQGAALLGLLPSVQEAMRALRPTGLERALGWQLWSRWLSEIIADFWAVARVGITSTVGLIGVVSLPRAFVFRASLEDPHPMPWIRVKLSAALGNALYPHPQWERLARLWEALYPAAALSRASRRVLDALEATMPDLVRLLIEHRPASLRGSTLPEVMRTGERQPERLAAVYRAWRSRRLHVRDAPPTLVFAALGQARNDGTLSPEEEGDALADLLKHWALLSTIDTTEICAPLARSRALRAVPRVAALLGGFTN